MEGDGVVWYTRVTVGGDREKIASSYRDTAYDEGVYCSKGIQVIHVNW